MYCNYSGAPADFIRWSASECGLNFVGSVGSGESENDKLTLMSAVALGALSPQRAKAYLGLNNHDPATTPISDLTEAQVGKLRALPEYKSLSALGTAYTQFWGNHDNQAHCSHLMLMVSADRFDVFRCFS